MVVKWNRSFAALSPHGGRLTPSHKVAWNMDDFEKVIDLNSDFKFYHLTKFIICQILFF